jgi:hypothetical protein
VHTSDLARSHWKKDNEMGVKSRSQFTREQQMVMTGLELCSINAETVTTRR